MKLLTLKKNSMTRIQKYTIPTLMSCVVFAIGTLFDSFWEPFFLAGFSLQAFTYLGLCRFLEDNKAKGPFSLLFNAHLVMVIALALLFYFVSATLTTTRRCSTPCMQWRCSPSLADISCRKSWLAHSSWANAKLPWVAP